MENDYKRFVDNEFKDYMVYSRLAKVEKNGQRRETLQKLAEVEKRHYNFWLHYTPDYRPSASKAFISLMIFARLLLGVTFVVKALENHEKRNLEQYKSIAEQLDHNTVEKQAIEKIINEEVEIERQLVGHIDEAVAKYLGFIMLGVADAIIELTGVQTGFLGVSSSTVVAGIAGLIVGCAAAVSMGAASYLQARQGVSENPAVSGLVTAVIYMLTVIALVFPYFILKDMLAAFMGAMAAALLLTAFFTYFTSILQEKTFLKEFAVNVSILSGVAAGTFLLGRALGMYFGIEGLPVA
ncbi:MAG: VIT1/CCC1 family protein [Candidatus Caldarchaeum sp.]|nr:VIT1/CCC1 family protein [Candidatus Caldarchaeum sp.]MDW8360250.1 VIT1/CCC1 family protein [Candidatus Caldarchaeum sp.]